MSNEDLNILDIYNIKKTSYVLDFKVPIDVRHINRDQLKLALANAFYQLGDPNSPNDDYFIYLDSANQEALLDEINELMIKLLFMKFCEVPSLFFENHNSLHMTEPVLISSIMYLIYGCQNTDIFEQMYEVIVAKATSFTWKSQQIMYSLAGPISRSILAYFFNINKLRFIEPDEELPYSDTDEDDNDLENLVYDYMVNMSQLESAMMPWGVF